MKDITAKAAYTFLFVLGGVIVGKLCQFAALALLEPRLGFDLASLAGLAPFLAVLLWLRAKYPRFFGFRHMWCRPAAPSCRR